MKDNILHSDPAKYHTYNDCTAEEEISAGTTEALLDKLKFIDNKIAEIEIRYTATELRLNADHSLRTITNLTAWYALIEFELQFRQATHIISTKAYIAPMVYLNQHVCTKRS